MNIDSADWHVESMNIGSADWRVESQLLPATKLSGCTFNCSMYKIAFLLHV